MLRMQYGYWVLVTGQWDVQDYGYRIVMKIEEELSKM